LIRQIFELVLKQPQRLNYFILFGFIFYLFNLMQNKNVTSLTLQPQKLHLSWSKNINWNFFTAVCTNVVCTNADQSWSRINESWNKQTINYISFNEIRHDFERAKTK